MGCLNCLGTSMQFLKKWQTQYSLGCEWRGKCYLCLALHSLSLVEIYSFSFHISKHLYRRVLKFVFIILHNIHCCPHSYTYVHIHKLMLRVTNQNISYSMVKPIAVFGAALSCFYSLRLLSLWPPLPQLISSIVLVKSYYEMKKKKNSTAFDKLCCKKSLFHVSCCCMRFNFVILDQCPCFLLLNTV